MRSRRRVDGSLGLKIAVSYDRVGATMITHFLTLHLGVEKGLHRLLRAFGAHGCLVGGYLMRCGLASFAGGQLVRLYSTRGILCLFAALGRSHIRGDGGMLKRR